MNRISCNSLIALLFYIFIFLFLVLLMTNRSFSAWVFERHQNQWSWYIRPLFVLPFCYFAWKRSHAGVSLTVFMLLTSMFWFKVPEVVDEDVKAFLQYEQEWLFGSWNLPKVLLLLTVPFSLIILGLSFWKRSVVVGLGVVVLIAAGKIFWSISNAGTAGKSILLPALAGLAICIGLILFVAIRKKNKTKDTGNE